MNCKKKKLQYIREKNHYREGGKGRGHLTLSRETLEDVEPTILEEIIKSSLSKFDKKFKMKFGIFEVTAGYNNNDFVLDSITLSYRFKKIELIGTNEKISFTDLTI